MANLISIYLPSKGHQDHRQVPGSSLRYEGTVALGHIRVDEIAMLQCLVLKAVGFGHMCG